MKRPNKEHSEQGWTGLLVSRVVAVLILLFVLLVLYVLSDGPAWALMRRADSRLARTCYRITYAPVNWVARQSSELDDALRAYGEWWDRTLPSF